MNQIINMIMRMLMRKMVSKGVDAGLNSAGKLRGKRQNSRHAIENSGAPAKSGPTQQEVRAARRAKREARNQG
jgi:hypothetical protein